MGKASKWIRNLLLGKREEKINKKDTSCKESLVISKAIIPATVPVEKRRWSFRRPSSTDKSTHKITRSFDSIITPQLVSQALLDYANLQQHQGAPAMVATTKFNTQLPSTGPTATKRGPGPAENAAATKIQASFRSYLARKALCALRGLVKLQALVRGHLVRKQMIAMIRCMNALMSIQVRARVQRIQLAEESYLVTKTRKVHMEQAQENMLSRGYNYRKDIKELKGMGGMKSQNGYLNHPQSQTDTMEHRLSTYSSGRISVSRREHQQQLYPISSPSTHASSRIYDQQVERLSLSRGHTSSQHYSSRAMFVDACMSSSAVHGDIGSSDQQFEPSYMAKTKSSKAKVRSHSEPKQRPVEKKSRRSTSNEGITTLTHSSSSNLRGDFHKNQNHWLVKLYRSSKSIKDIEFDSTSMSTDNSSYCRTFLAYERPDVNLY